MLAIRGERKEEVLVEGRAQPWIASPEPGVERRLLERTGGEVALATSIVRYAPGSRFSRHEHALGEEMFVGTGAVELLASPNRVLDSWAWRRSAAGDQPALRSAAGALLWIKRGHL